MTSFHVKFVLQTSMPLIDENDFIILLTFQTG